MRRCLYNGQAEHCEEKTNWPKTHYSDHKLSIQQPVTLGIVYVFMWIKLPSPFWAFKLHLNGIVGVLLLVCNIKYWMSSMIFISTIRSIIVVVIEYDVHILIICTQCWTIHLLTFSAEKKIIRTRITIVLRWWCGKKMRLKTSWHMRFAIVVHQFSSYSLNEIRFIFSCLLQTSISIESYSTYGSYERGAFPSYAWAPLCG